MCFSFENNILAFISVEPTNISVVHFKMILSHWMSSTNSMEDTVWSIDLYEVDPSSNSNSKLRLSLEFGALEANVYAPQICDIAAVAIWNLCNERASCHLGIVIKARFIWSGCTVEFLKVEVCDKSLCGRNWIPMKRMSHAKNIFIVYFLFSEGQQQKCYNFLSQ